jgi:hypothetical protein
LDVDEVEENQEQDRQQILSFQQSRGSSVVEQPIRNRNLTQREQTEPTYT